VTRRSASADKQAVDRTDCLLSPGPGRHSWLVPYRVRRVCMYQRHPALLRRVFLHLYSVRLALPCVTYRDAAPKLTFSVPSLASALSSATLTPRGQSFNAAARPQVDRARFSGTTSATSAVPASLLIPRLPLTDLPLTLARLLLTARTDGGMILAAARRVIDRTPTRTERAPSDDDDDTVALPSSPPPPLSLSLSLDAARNGDPRVPPAVDLAIGLKAAKTPRRLTPKLPFRPSLPPPPPRHGGGREERRSVARKT